MNRKTSFPAVWQGLSGAQRSELRIRIIAEVRVSDVTLYRWQRGMCIPDNYPTRAAVAGVVSKFTGRDLTAEDLFPDR